MLMLWLALYQFEGEEGQPGDRFISDYNLAWHRELYQQMVSEGRLNETRTQGLYEIPLGQLPTTHYCRVCKKHMTPKFSVQEHKMSCPVPYEPGGALYNG